MDDRSLVAALRTGLLRGLAGIYDGYADRLLAYAVLVAPDADAAAEAVHDALLIARERIDRLPDPDRLRPWLYALVRNECVRARRERHAGAPVPVEREVRELTGRHELAAAELAAVLGVSAGTAAALTARSGAPTGGPVRDASGEPARGRDAASAADPGGDPAGGATGGATSGASGGAIGGAIGGATRGAFELAAPGLRARVLEQAGLAGYPQRLAERAGPWRADGFPVPLARPRRITLPDLRRSPVWWAAAAVAVLALLVTTGLALRPGPAPLTSAAGDRLPTALPVGEQLTGDDGSSPPAATASAPGTVPADATTQAGPSSPSGSPTSTTGPSPTAATSSGSATPTTGPSPTPAPTTPVPGPTTPTVVPTTPPPPPVTTPPPPVPAVTTRWAVSAPACPKNWRARLTATVTGTTATAVSASFTGGGGAPSRVAMTRSTPGTWTLTLTLPAGRRLTWTATATTPAGRLASAARALSYTCGP